MRLGIDCGGTKTEAVVLDKNEVLLHIKYNKPSSRKNVIKIIKEVLSKEKRISQIGIGFPSPLINGLTTEINNVKDWVGVNINEFIENEFNIKCVSENDANCFVLAESKHISNKKYKSIVGITLGTGLGCGLVINQKIVSGNTGSLGELSRIPFKGKTLEDFTSKKFFLQKFNEDPIHIFKRAKEGILKDKKIVEMYGKNLGQMLSIVCLAYDPKCIILGGSISNSFDEFYPYLIKELQKYLYKSQIKSLIIKKSSVQFSGAVGAALL